MEIYELRMHMLQSTLENDDEVLYGANIISK